MTSSPSLTEARKRPAVLQRAEISPRFRLTPRDEQILEAVYRHRALTRDQIERLFFGPPGKEPDTRCQHRLKVLYQAGYLDRGFQARTPLEGLKPLIYFLDQNGAEHLARTLDEPIDWRKRDNDVGWWFLDHLLATNDVRIALQQNADEQGWNLVEWRDDKTLKRQMRDKVEVSWVDEKKKPHRVRVGLVPDGYFVLTTPEDRFSRFLEVDMGTVPGEATRDSRRSWALRARAYLAYYRSGAYERDYRAQGLRVLVVTTTPRRTENLMRATATAGGRDLFLFTTLELVKSTDPLTDPIWQRPGSAERFRAI